MPDSYQDFVSDDEEVDEEEDLNEENEGEEEDLNENNEDEEEDLEEEDEEDEDLEDLEEQDFEEEEEDYEEVNEEDYQEEEEEDLEEGEEEEEDEDFEEEAHSPFDYDSDNAMEIIEEEAEYDRRKGTVTIGESNGNEIEEGDCCSICMEPWSSEAGHQVSCLPCGHVYGSSCIERWIRQCRNNSGKCPQCSRKCSLKDIIKLYLSHIVIADGEHQKKLLSLQAENEILKMKTRMQEIESQQPKGSQSNTNMDTLSQVMGEDGHESAKMMGLGVSPTTLRGAQPTHEEELLREAIDARRDAVEEAIRAERVAVRAERTQARADMLLAQIKSLQEGFVAQASVINQHLGGEPIDIDAILHGVSDGQAPSDGTHPTPDGSSDPPT